MSFSTLRFVMTDEGAATELAAIMQSIANDIVSSGVPMLGVMLNGLEVTVMGDDSVTTALAEQLADTLGLKAVDHG